MTKKKKRKLRQRVRRTPSLTVWLSEGERRALARAAKANGKSLLSFAREVLGGAAQAMDRARQVD